MIFNLQTAKKQIHELLRCYPKLTIEDETEEVIRLRGDILVFRTFNDYTVRKEYPIEIVVPINSDELPYVRDYANAVRISYKHVYSDGRLCLEADIVIRKRFSEGFDLVSWVDEYVEAYFFSFEYYSEFGVFPFGDRKHGFEGICEAYMELLNTSNPEETIRLMYFITTHNYRGHFMCPCESGKRFRDCHGPQALQFYKYSSLMKQLKKDLLILEKEFNDYIKRKNTSKAE